MYSTSFVSAALAMVAVSLPLTHASSVEPRDSSMTGLSVVTNLQQLSLVYQTLTFMTTSLQLPTNLSDPSAIIALYTNITTTETGDETAPQPATPVNEFDQYGILAAQLALVTSDRAFLNALLGKKQFFNATQKAKVRDLVGMQIGVANTFDVDVAGFAPDVLPAVEQNTAVLNASLAALQAAFV